MHLKKICAGLAAAGLTLVSNTLLADTTIVYENSSSAGVESGKTQIAQGKVLVSTGEGVRAIFDTENAQFVTINDGDRSYMVMGKAQIDEIVDMQKQMMAQVEAQMSALPPAQRAQMKKMMSSMMPDMGAEAAPRSYQRSGESKEISGYKCDVLEVYSGDRKASQQCVTSADELNIPEQDYATIRSMGEFVQDLSQSFGQISEEIMDFGEPGRDEFPVEFIHYGKVSGTSTGQMKSISHDDIDPSAFEIPSGYKQIELPKMSELGL